MSPRITDFKGVLEGACRRGPFRVVVACGHDPAALKALAQAESRGLAHGILVGDPGLIGPAIDALPHRLQHAEIVDAADEASAVRRAVELVRGHVGQILLKGKTQTATLMHAVLDREGGLRTGRLLSDAFLFEYPAPEGTRLLCVTDGGINLTPDLTAKRQIIENAVQLYQSLGHARPRVAVLSAVETVIPGHGPSQDAAALAKMAHAGQLCECEVEGPLSLDLAISPEAVAKKGHIGPVAGKADILLCPDIISADLLAKSTTYFARYPLAHVIMGASAPVLIPSRSDTPEAKLLSIALGALTVR